MPPAPTGRLEMQAQHRRRRALLAYLAPVTLAYLVFLVVPYALLLRMSLNRFNATAMYDSALTLENYVAVLTGPFYLSLMARTVALGLAVTVITLALGFPLALTIARATGRLKTLLMAITLSPLLINLVVRTYAWLVLLGDKGLINSWLLDAGLIASPLPLGGSLFAVVVGLSHITLPLMVLSLLAVIESIDSRLAEAAESLGATQARIFRRITLPLSLPGIGTGSLLVFCFAISAFVTPALLGGNRVSTISTVIYDMFSFSLNWPVGATLVFVLLVLNFAVLGVHARLFRER